MTKASQWRFWAGQRTSRNQNWSEKETATLIKVWLKYLDSLKLHRRTGKIYEMMSAEFAQNGFKRTTVELQKKVSNLTQEYRKESAKQKKGLGPSKWKFFAAVEEIASQLSLSRGLLCDQYPVSEAHTSTSSKQSESDTDNNMDDVKFMTVFLDEKSMSADEEGEEDSNPLPQMPVIVSVESQHPDHKALALQQAENKKVMQDLKTDLQRAMDEKPVEHTQFFRPILQESANKKVLQDLKTDMQRVMEQSQPVPHTLFIRPTLTESANKNTLQDLKTEMHRVLEESLDMHRQQVAMQQRQIVLQEDMLKIMAKFIDNSP